MRVKEKVLYVLILIAVIAIIGIKIAAYAKIAFI